MVTVVVKDSPFKNIKYGAVGEIIERRYIGTVYEILKVRFENGEIHSFHPDEIEERVEVGDARGSYARANGRF